MGLEINQTYAKIGIETTPARVEIETQNAKLELSLKQAKLNIHTELPKIQIDQYEAFASAGLMNYIDLTKDAARRAYQQVMEYIAKVSGDGDTFAAIENKGSPIANMAERDAYPVHEFDIGTIPKVGPRFSVKGGTVDIQPEINRVEGNYTPGKVNLYYTPGKVNIYLLQNASINISYQGNKVDKKI